MTAADHLRPDLLSSPDLWSVLLPLSPDEVRVKPAPRWMRSLWAPRIAAMTIGASIYVDRAFLAQATPNALSRLMVHELIHARQWKDKGALGFLFGYVRQYLAGRLSGQSHEQAYQGISFEEEARAAERSIK